MKFAILFALSVIGYTAAMDFCPACCKLVEFIKLEEQRDESAEEAVLNKACADVTHSNSNIEDKLCTIVIDEVLKLAVNWFEKDVSATKVCQDVGGICSDSQTCPNSVPNAFLQQAVAGQICTEIDAIIKDISGGAIDNLCKELHIDDIKPGLCEEIKGVVEPALLRVAEIVKALLCSGQISSEMMAAAATNKVCDDINELISIIKGGALDKECTDLGLPKGVCNAVKAVEGKLLNVLELIAKLAGCSSSNSLTYLDVASKLAVESPCDLIKEVLRILQSGEIEGECSALGLPAFFCSELKQYVGVVIQVVSTISKFLKCPSFAARPLILANGPICTILNEISSAIASGELDSLCKQYVPPAQQPQVCGQLKNMEAAFTKVLDFLKPLLKC